MNSIIQINYFERFNDFEISCASISQKSGTTINVQLSWQKDSEEFQEIGRSCYGGIKPIMSQMGKLKNSSQMGIIGLI